MKLVCNFDLFMTQASKKYMRAALYNMSFDPMAKYFEWLPTGVYGFLRICCYQL